MSAHSRIRAVMDVKKIGKLKDSNGLMGVFFLVGLLSFPRRKIVESVRAVIDPTM